MTNRDRVLSFVQNNPGRTQQEISKALGITPDTGQQVNHKLHELMKEGLVKRDEQKMPYKYYPVSASVQTSTESFPIKCAYCKGKGIDPDPGSFALGPRDCPVCKGGWRVLPGNLDDYKPCQSCDENWQGKDRDDIVCWKPCHICNGTGLVKVR